MATGIMLRTMSGTFCSLILAAISLAGLRAQMVPGLDAIRVASGLTQPLFVTAPPGDSGRLFIVQQNGRIRTLNLPQLRGRDRSPENRSDRGARALCSRHPACCWMSLPRLRRVLSCLAETSNGDYET